MGRECKMDVRRVNVAVAGVTDTCGRLKRGKNRFVAKPEGSNRKEMKKTLSNYFFCVKENRIYLVIINIG